MGKYGYEMKLIEPEAFNLWLMKASLNHVKVMLIILYYTGIRISEAITLSPRDLATTEDGYLRINAIVLKNLNMRGKRRSLDIPLNPHTHLLLDYATRRTAEGNLTMFDRGVRWFRYRFKEIDPELSPHRFRHNRLSRLAELGVDSYAIRDWAGHTDTRPASAYIKVSGILARNAARKVNII